jgi:hypothetical protein
MSKVVKQFDSEEFETQRSGFKLINSTPAGKVVNIEMSYNKKEKCGELIFDTSELTHQEVFNLALTLRENDYI